MSPAQRAGVRKEEERSVTGSLRRADSRKTAGAAARIMDGGTRMLNDEERELLAEIASMAERLRDEVEALRADLAEVRESSAPGSDDSSGRRLPA